MILDMVVAVTVSSADKHGNVIINHKNSSCVEVCSKLTQQIFCFVYFFPTDVGNERKSNQELFWPNVLEWRIFLSCALILSTAPYSLFLESEYLSE